MNKRNKAPGPNPTGQSLEHRPYAKSILRGILAALIVLATLASKPPMAAASTGAKISITFTFTGFTASDPGTCDPSTFLPFAGDPACIASVALENATSGDFEGTEFEEDALTFFANGAGQVVDYEMFTGTLKGHPAGSVVMLGYDIASTPSGVLSGKLRILDGTGAGGLEGISGSGSFTGSNVTGISVATLMVEFPGK